MSSNPRAMDDLNNILNERVTLYSKADLTINTENISISESYKKLKTKLLSIKYPVLPSSKPSKYFSLTSFFSRKS